MYWTTFNARRIALLFLSPVFRNRVEQLIDATPASSSREPVHFVRHSSDSLLNTIPETENGFRWLSRVRPGARAQRRFGRFLLSAFIALRRTAAVVVHRFSEVTTRAWSSLSAPSGGNVVRKSLRAKLASAVFNRHS